MFEIFDDPMATKELQEKTVGELAEFTAREFQISRHLMQHKILEPR